MVKFHRFPNLTYKRALEEAYVNNWNLASAGELQQDLDNLNYEPFAVGWVSDGKLAVPITTATSTLSKGLNLGVIDWEMEPLSPYKKVYPTKGINEGFFYVEGKPVIEADKPAPDTYVEEEIVNGGIRRYSPEEWLEETRRRDILKGPFPAQERAFNYDQFNVMIDGWESEERPLLESAARALLNIELKPAEVRDIKLFSLEIKVDPVRRFQFAAFLLGELYQALASSNPTAAQKKYQDRFNHFTTCKKWLYTTKILEDWKTHTNDPGAVVQRLADGSYKAPTLSVWIDVMHDRASKKGFIPLEIAGMYYTPKGTELVSQLFAPTYAKEFSDLEDRINLKSIGGNLSDVLKGTLGLTAFSLMMVGTGAFALFVAREKALRHAAALAKLQAKREDEFIRMHKELAKEVEAENIETARVVDPAGTTETPVTVEPPGENELVQIPKFDRATRPQWNFKDFGRMDAAIEEMNEDAVIIIDKVATNPALKEKIVKFFAAVAEKAKASVLKLMEKAAAELLERFPWIKTLQELATKVSSKFGSLSFGAVVSIVGILITAAEILGVELADIISSNKYDEDLRTAAEWNEDNVSAYLNPNTAVPELEKEGRKVGVLHDLLYFMISLPGERGILSFDYPELATEFGKKKGLFGKQFWDVKYFKVYDQPFEHVKKMAASRNMRLATEDEVIQAMFYLELTGPRAVINTGEFVYPVGGNFFVDQGEMIEPGLNRGISGDNDGFYYIDVKPEPGVIIDPIPALPNNRKPDFEIVIINNAWLKKALQKSNTTDVIIGDGDHWKIIYKDSFVKKGMVRIQHVKTGLYLMSIYSYNNPIPRIELGRPVNDYTFMLLGNYGLWTIEEMVTYPGYLAIKNEEGLFLNTEGGILQVTNIQSNWFSPAWQLIN